jgi:thermitase
VNITVANGTASTTTSTSADTTAPVAHISKPWNGTWIGTAVNISASATDNVGVTSISVYVDGVLIAVGNAASLYYYWDSSKLAHGTHKITATAKDKAGNAGSTSISVYH